MRDAHARPTEPERAPGFPVGTRFVIVQPG